MNFYYINYFCLFFRIFLLISAKWNSSRWVVITKNLRIPIQNNILILVMCWCVLCHVRKIFAFDHFLGKTKPSLFLVFSSTSTEIFIEFVSCDYDYSHFKCISFNVRLMGKLVITRYSLHTYLPSTTLMFSKNVKGMWQVRFCCRVAGYM